MEQKDEKRIFYDIEPSETFPNLQKPFQICGRFLQWQHNAKVPHHSAFSKVEKTQNTQIELGPKENIL